MGDFVEWVLAVTIMTAVVCFGVDVLLAQFVCFGLAQWHVQSGLAGPFILLCVATSVISAGVTIGVKKK